MNPQSASSDPGQRFDFDRVIRRRGTASFKWDTYTPDRLPLWVADMDFAAPPVVLEALRRRVDHGVFGYAVMPDSLYEAIAAHLLHRYGWRIEHDWIVILPGVVPGLALACWAFAEAGDEVMLITPAYPPFFEVACARDRRMLAIPSTVLDGRWQLPLEAMEAAVTPRTRVLLFCHPHNPIGRVWSREELVQVQEFCRRHDLILCSDEIHCDLILDDLSHVPGATVHESAPERTITLMAPSKTFNLPGLQFAFAVIPDADLRRRFRDAGGGLVEHDLPGVFGVAATEAAYREGEPWRQALLEYLRGNRDLVERFVAEELPGFGTTHVEATYLAWLDARCCLPAEPYRLFLDAGVALSEGGDFGAPGYVRLNFGCPRSVLLEALRRMAAVR